MKYLKLIVALLVLMAAGTGSTLADRGHFQSQPGHFQTGQFHGHHGHFRSHVFVGFGFDPFWYPWYYSPPPVVVYSPPPVYVEQGQNSATSGNYWYYCAESGRYYPYVTECPGGWHAVMPTPPDSR